MISARITDGARDITQRLTSKAKRIALMHGENAIRTRRNDPLRWRTARLLWPLFERDG